MPGISGFDPMQKRHWLSLGLITVGLTASASYYYWRGSKPKENLEVLSFVPRDAAAVIYINVAALRDSAFLAQLAAWVPSQKDADYTQFLQATAFDFERDLNQVAIAVQKLAASPEVTFIASGNFDRKKISAYALRYGAKQQSGEREIFSVSTGGSGGDFYFTFLSAHLMMLTNSAARSTQLSGVTKNSPPREWQEHFDRLGGSPAFAVIRQDSRVALAEKVPGGFRSPQLASLLNNLQWITIAGKPEDNQLRVVAEGESESETTSYQLSDLLNGVMLLAQAGLNDRKVREQLDPAIREACLDLLKSADVSRVDRGQTKAVRLVFSVTPAFLEAARASLPVKPPPGATPDSRKIPPASSRKSGT